jgi:hypothetical protein
MCLWRRGQISAWVVLFLVVKLGLGFCTDLVNLDAIEIERFVLCLGSLWEDYECCFDCRRAGLRIH